MTKIDLILPTRNHVEDLTACLRSVNDSFDTKKYEVEVVIVDDHSSKEEREQIITNFVKFNICKNLTVKTLFMSKNVGFAKACNIGIKSIIGGKKPPKYIGILHDDVKVFDKWLDNLVGEIENDITTWCASSMSTCKFDKHNVDVLEINELRGSDFADEDMNDFISMFLTSDKTFYADRVQTFATLFKAETFEKHGYFNEDCITPINIEYELCDKLRAAERTLKVVPSACVKHLGRIHNKYENPNQATYEKHKKATEYLQSIRSEMKSIRKPYVLYTFIKDNEQVPMYSEFDESVEYVCFTANALVLNQAYKYVPWKIYKVDDFADFFGFRKSSMKMKEFIKLNPHLFFSDTSMNVSIWIDPMYSDAKGVKDIVKKMSKDNFMICGDLPDYDCSYRYLMDLKKNTYITASEFDNILQIYRWTKYPNENGIADTSILVRKHNDERCRTAMGKMWNFCSNTFPNSQLFFNLVMWMLKYDYSYVPTNLLLGNHLTLREN